MTKKLSEKTKKEIGGCYVLAVPKEESWLKRDPTRRIFQPEDVAAQDKVLEEPLEQDLIRVC